MNETTSMDDALCGLKIFTYYHDPSINLSKHVRRRTQRRFPPQAPSVSHQQGLNQQTTSLLYEIPG